MCDTDSFVVGAVRYAEVITKYNDLGLNKTSNQICVNQPYTNSWNALGPFVGNAYNSIGNLDKKWMGRINAVARNPKDDNVIYIGTHRAGLFKSINGGQSWFNVTDKNIKMVGLGIQDIYVHPVDTGSVIISTGYGL